MNLQARDVASQLALQVRSFVVVPGATLCQPVYHADDLRQELLGFRFLLHFTELTDRSPGGLLVVTIVYAALRFLTHALL